LFKQPLIKEALFALVVEQVKQETDRMAGPANCVLGRNGVQDMLGLKIEQFEHQARIETPLTRALLLAMLRTDEGFLIEDNLYVPTSFPFHARICNATGPPPPPPPEQHTFYKMHLMHLKRSAFTPDAHANADGHGA
jgi:hypothetical protein